MKITVNRAAFAQSLTHAVEAVPSRTPKPVLACVKIVATKGEVCILGTNMELAIRSYCRQVDVTQPGECCIPAEKLLGCIASIADDTVTLETVGEDFVAHIKHSRGVFKIFGFKPDEFPPVSEYAKAEGEVRIPAATLDNMLGKVEYAAAKVTGRYATCAILFELTGSKIKMASTDGHRLAVASDDCVSQAVKCPVPVSTIAILRKICGNAEEETAAMQFSDTRIAAAIMVGEEVQTVLTSTIMEGQFPPYDSVIPKTSKSDFMVDREAFTSALRQAALMTNEESKGVRLSFTKDKLTITGRAAERGEAIVEITGELTQGDAIEIGVNPEFLREYLKTAEAATVTIKMETPTRPLNLKCDAGVTAIIMPVNLT